MESEVYISMGFNLWFANVREIENYYLSRGRQNGRERGIISGQIMLGDEAGVVPLALNIDGRTEEEFSLEEIDSVLCSYRDSKAVLKALGFGDAADETRRLIVASGYDEIGKFQVVYNSPFLEKCADTIRRKRSQGGKAILDDTPEMRKFVGRILDYATSESTRDLLLSFSLLIPPVKDTLRKYGYSKSQNNEESSMELSESFFEACLNYKVTRAFVIWEQDYLATKSNQASSTSRRGGVNDITKAYEALRLQESLRIEPVSGAAARVADEFMRERDPEKGGIDWDAFYAMYDFGDISTGDMKRLGLLPPDYTDKVSHTGKKK